MTNYHHDSKPFLIIILLFLIDYLLSIDFTRDQSILLTLPKSHPSSTGAGGGGNVIVSHHASVGSMSVSGGTHTSSSNDEDMVTSENINKIWKRRYRRRARIDNNAPKKPPSAYVMFSNDIRAELKAQNLSFTMLSKITGDRWKNLEPNERKFYEVKADYAKDDYILAQAKYQLTDEHKVKKNDNYVIMIIITDIYKYHNFHWLFVVITIIHITLYSNIKNI